MDPVERNEGIAAHKQDGPGNDCQRQLGEFLPVVFHLFGFPGSFRAFGFGLLHAREVRDLVEEDDRHDEGYEAENGRAGHTERADGRYREHGAEYETAVAAYGKEAQACALGSAGNLIGETRALGMEQGRAHAAEGNGRENGPVAVQEADGSQPAPGQQDAHGNEPRLGKLVGQIAESRLNNRGEAGEGEHQPGGGLIVETVRGDQKGQDGGQRAAVYVARQMPERHKENFLFVHDDDLCPQAGTDEGKRAFPAARRADAAATAQWIVGNLRRKSKALSGKKQRCAGGLWKGERGDSVYCAGVTPCCVFFWTFWPHEKSRG